MLANNPLVIFVLSLVAGLVSVADLAHKGQDKAGSDKKAWVIAQLNSLLSGPLPVIPGVNPYIVSGVFAVLKWVLPLAGDKAIDYVVSVANSNSFFVKIEGALSSVLSGLFGGAELTLTGLSATSEAH